MESDHCACNFTRYIRRTKMSMRIWTSVVALFLLVVSVSGKPKVTVGGEIHVTKVHPHQPADDSLLQAINFKPRFSVTNLIIKIQENKVPGSVIEDISKYAKDDENDHMMYDIDSSGAQICSISRLTGKLSLTISPDRETRAMYKFQVFASDDFEGGLNRQASLTVFLYILDENDNNPVFINTPYHTKIKENVPNGSLVMKIQAEDKDAGRNADIRYSFTDKTTTDMFSIDSLTGDVTLRGTLDYEDKQSHTMFIKAKDGGSPSRFELTTLVVEVLDVGDMPPYFVYHHYDRLVGENFPQGSSIAIVSARDGDLAINNPIHYVIVGGDEYGLFAVDEKTGNITVKGVLDREFYKEFDLQIKAYEYPEPESYEITELRITLLDINDNKPKFEKDSYQIRIPDNTQPKNIISDTIKAVDEDATFENNNIRYSVGPGAGDTFGVLQESGELVLLKPVNFHKQNKYIFKIVASETHTRERYSSSANVTVIIEEAYDPIVAKQGSSANAIDGASSLRLLLFSVLTCLLYTLAPNR